MFQGFSNDLMMLIGNLMQWKFRMPSVMKKMLRNMTEKTIHDIMTKTDWKDESVHKTCVAIRKYKQALGDVYKRQIYTNAGVPSIPTSHSHACTSLLNVSDSEL